MLRRGPMLMFPRDALLVLILTACCYVSSVAMTIAEITGLRSRDLKKLLYKLGVTHEEVKKIVDMQELRSLAISLIQEEAQQKQLKSAWDLALKWTLVALIVAFVFIFREPFLHLVRSFIDHLRAVRYQLKIKRDMILVCYENALYTALLSFVLASLLDLAGPLMQISITMSWILPSQSFLRRFLFPSLSIPVTADMVLSGLGGGGKGKGAASPLSGYGLNIGPMVTMWICTWIKGRLEEYGASKIHRIVYEKEQKRATKRQDKYGFGGGGGGGGGGGDGFSYFEGEEDMSARSSRSHAYASRPPPAPPPPPPPSYFQREQDESGKFPWENGHFDEQKLRSKSGPMLDGDEGGWADDDNDNNEEEKEKEKEPQVRTFETSSSPFEEID